MNLPRSLPRIRLNVGNRSRGQIPPNSLLCTSLGGFAIESRGVTIGDFRRVIAYFRVNFGSGYDTRALETATSLLRRRK